MYSLPMFKAYFRRFWGGAVEIAPPAIIPPNCVYQLINNTSVSLITHKKQFINNMKKNENKNKAIRLGREHKTEVEIFEKEKNIYV